MSFFIRLLLSAAVLFGFVLPAASQASLAARPQVDRIAVRPSFRATTRLAGHVPSWANARNDAGTLAADTSLCLTFILTRSPERQAAFEQLLADQQNPASPNYHHWLTPQQIGAIYGPTAHDLATLTDWLNSQGLAITETAPSGIFLSVQAPASTVANALNTSFHNFSLRTAATEPDTPHYAATTDPAIPSAFATIIGSIQGLADIPQRPMHHLEPVNVSVRSEPAPLATGSNGTHYLTPADFAVIYNINPVSQSGIDGTGQKVAIVGRSRVNPVDITNFETFAGLPAKQPNIIVPPSGVDPGPVSPTSPSAEQVEATLDVERVIATAHGAQADLIIANSASGGIQTAAQYNVQTLLDPIMNISFGSCEANASPTTLNFWNNLFSQAAMEGISIFVSSGDSGVDACELGGSLPTAGQPRSTNVICSSSYATCVGGTQFADLASPSTYWSATNGSGLQSALGYIPEGAWNEPVGSGSKSFVALGTGGGASAFIAKPSWQTGVGVPADGFRDVPDVSFSSSGHDGYLICFTATSSDCTSTFAVIGGTSAAAPAMAGIAALLNQKVGIPQGNINSLLYRLAASVPAVFHDATPATSGVTCDINTPSTCNNSTPSATALTGGLIGYALAIGYDQATGLGSLDVASFINATTAAPGISLSPTASSLTVVAGATSGNSDLLTISSGSFSGNVTLNCTVTFNGPGNVTSLPGCGLSPNTLTLTSGGSATSNLTITTSAANPAALLSQPLSVAPTQSHPAFIAQVAFGSLLLFVLIPAAKYRNSLGKWRLLPALILLGSVSLLSACSGSGMPLTANPLLISSSSTSLSASASSLPAGSPGTFSVAVASTGYNKVDTPGGTVQLQQNGSNLATVTLVGGKATSAPIVFNTPGTYTITAVYNGDNNFSSSTSAGVPLTVLPNGSTTPGSYTVTVSVLSAGSVVASSRVALTVQ